MTYVFGDIAILRECIEVLNDTIDKYGCINLDYMKRLMGAEIPTFKDSHVGWTEKFSEVTNVKPRLKTTWMFEFTIPEPKEL